MLKSKVKFPMRTTTLPWGAVISAALLSACSPLQKMSEMNDTTKHMDVNTTKMADTTTQLVQEMKDMRGDINDMKSDTHELSGKMDSVDTHITDMTGDIKNVSSQMTSVSTHIESVDKQMGTMSKQMGEVATSVNGMAGKMDTVAGAVNKMSGKMDNVDGHMTAMSGDIKHMSAGMDSMQGDTHAMNGAMGGLSADMKGVSSAVAGMSKQMTSVNNSMTGMSGDIKHMSSGMDSMQGDTHAMNGAMGGLSADMKGVSSAVAGMSKQMTSVDTHMTGLSADIKDMRTQLTSVDGHITAMSGDIKSVATNMGGVSKHIESVDGQLGGVNTNMTRVAGSVDRMAGQMTGVSNAVNGMARQMTGVETAVNGMASKLDALQIMMGNLYNLAVAGLEDARQGMSMTLRRESMEAIDKETTLEAKMVRASQYYMSFEYQLWRAFGADTVEKREKMEKNAAEEFALTINRYFDKKRSAAPTSKAEPMKALYALAATLDAINPNMELRDDAGKTKAYSMQFLVERALFNKAHGKQMSNADHTILIYPQDMVYLLQIRLNFLAAVILSKISDIQEANLLEKILMRYGNIFGHHWQPKIPKLNFEQSRFLTDLVQKATHERKFLIGIGADTRLDKDVAGIYRNMAIPAGLGGGDRGDAERELLENILEFRK